MSVFPSRREHSNRCLLSPDFCRGETISCKIGVKAGTEFPLSSARRPMPKTGGTRDAQQPLTICSCVQDFANTHLLGAFGLQAPASTPALSASAGADAPSNARSRPRRPPALQRVQSTLSGSPNPSSNGSPASSSSRKFLDSDAASPMDKKIKKEFKKSMSSRKCDAKERSPKEAKDVESPVDKDVLRDVEGILKSLQGRKAKDGICWKSIGESFRNSSIRRHANQ